MVSPSPRFCLARTPRRRVARRLARRSAAGGALLSVIAASLVAVVAPTAVTLAPAYADAGGQPHVVAVLPDMVSAQRQARVQHSRVEIADRRTATSSTFANADGTFSLEQHESPVWARGSAGSWVPVDNSLHVVRGALRAAASDVDAAFSADGTGAAATISNNGGTVDVSAPTGVVDAPAVTGNDASYDLADGSQMHLRALPTGVDQTIVLSGPPATAPVLRFPLNLHGLTATQGSDGTIDIGGPHGSVVSVPPALMWGSDVDPGTDQPLHRVNVDMTLSGSSIVLRPSMDFLSDPSVRYPVTIDPTYRTVDAARAGDVTLSTANKTATGVTSAVHMVDGLSAGGFIYRNFENWSGVSLPTGSSVISAQLALFQYDAATCAAKTTYAYAISAPWNGSTITWNTQPGVNASYHGGLAFNNGDEAAGCSNGWARIDITNVVRAWLTPAGAPGSIPNYGLNLRSSNEADNTGWKSFCTQNSQATDCSGVQSSDPSALGRPTLTVTYNTPPEVPFALFAQPSGACAAGGSPCYAPSTTPTLNALVYDQDGGTSYAQFQIWNAGGAQIGGNNTSTTPSGGATNNGQVSWQVPPGLLVDGSSYSFRAEGWDGALTSLSYSAFSTFTVDVSAPAAPTIDSSDPAQQWSPNGGSASFTFTGYDSLSGVDYYRYSLDNPTPTQTTANGAANGPETVSLSGIADGWHTLYAQAVDAVGNVSGVASYSFGVGTGPSIASPAAGTITQNTFALSGGNKPGATQAMFYYRRTSNDNWTLIPATDVAAANGSPSFAGWPYTFPALPSNGSTTPALNWNATNTMASAASTLATSPVQLGVCFGDTTRCPTSSAMLLPVDISNVTPSQVTWDRNGFFADSQNVGPAQVNLLTGNAQISATDATVPGNSGATFAVGRSFNTWTAATTTGIFGPGWTPSLPVPSAGADFTSLTDTGTVLTVTNSDQSTTNFDASHSPAVPTGADADSGLTVKPNSSDCTAGYGCYELDDLDGNRVVFQSDNTSPAGGTVAAPVTYRMIKVIQPGTATSTTFRYDGSHRVTQIIGPPPAGGTCTDETLAANWTPGCRGLLLTYDANGHLTKASYVTSDGTNPLTVDVACYSYNGTGGRLSDAWDPRDIPDAAGAPISCNPAAPVRPTHYDYDSSGRIQKITPDYSATATPIAGWTLNYDGSGRLASVTRAHTNGSGTESTTVVYNVSTNPNGTLNRPDVTAATTAGWAQTDVPDTTVNGTAICPPSAATVVTDPAGDLRDCTLSYLDANGRTVNTANYSGTTAAGWHITTTEYDTLGHVIRTLSAADRDEALNNTTGAGAALGLGGMSTANAALALSTVNQYTANSQDGQPDLTATFGPYHQIVLPNGTVTAGRAYTATAYDNSTDDFNAPEAGDPAGNSGSLHLPVKVITSASLSTAATLTNSTDRRETDSHYSIGSDTTGWTFRKPMQTIVDPTFLDLVTTTLYDPKTGNVTYTRMPSAAGDTTDTTAGTTHMLYYSAGSGSTGSGDPTCDNKPQWDGLVCKTTNGNTTPTTGLPSLVTTVDTSYDYLGRPTRVDESSSDTGGAVTRTTSTTYGFNSTATNNPYATTVQSTAVTGGEGVDVGTQSTSYDSATGLVSGVTTGTSADSTRYDDFGRVTLYTDNVGATGAFANNATTSYDPTHGWVTQTTDAHTTTTLRYDENNEHRGLPTSKVVTVSGTTSYTGTYTASYDADGNLASETDPNGATSSYTRDETGLTASLSTVKAGNTLVSDSQTRSVYGQVRTRSGPVAAQTYAYDSAGRLSTAGDTPAGSSCAIRKYGYDSDSNRTSSTAYPASTSNNCSTLQVGVNAVNTNHLYDAADRLQASGGDTGLSYDAFGRITTVPAPDTNNNQTLNISYYRNDLVAAESQGTTTQCWRLDAEQRLAHHSTYAVNSCIGTPTADTTNHYDDASSDSPDWTSENTDSSHWTADVTDPNGNLALTVDQTGTPTYTYTDLHGTVAATVTGTGAAVYAPDYDEFGNNPTGTATRYGWLGGKQRAADDMGGVVLMGVRLYSPALGRFLQTDPVPGGSANNYDYANQDPINNTDLDGNMVDRYYIDGGGYGGGGAIAVGLGLGAAAKGLWYAGSGMAAGAYHSISSGASNAWNWIWHSQHGKKNVEHSHHVGVSDEDLKKLLVDPLTDSIEKAKIRQTLKGRGQRRSRQNRENKQ